MEKIETNQISWLRYTFKLFLQYLCIPFSAIPTTLLYIKFVNSGINESTAYAMSLSVGIVIGLTLWLLIGKYLFRHKQISSVVDKTADNQINIYFGTDINLLSPSRLSITATSALAVVVFSSVPNNNPPVVVTFKESDIPKTSTVATSEYKLETVGF